MIYYHRFYVESLYPENRRRILRWLFFTFSVYLCEATPAGYKGRFYTQDIRFPKAAFRDLAFSLRGDRSLCLWVISYDLHTLYLERNIYIYGKWLPKNKSYKGRSNSTDFSDMWPLLLSDTFIGILPIVRKIDMILLSLT